MLIDVNGYSQSLKKLWADTFGDNEEYISLLFNYEYTPTECFAEIENGELISVLYLLKGYIKTENKVFEGRYLYAAATAEKHRGKGIMAKLIREAQSYIAENNISFISLVPADEGLYGYYSKFGFEPLMKNYVAVIDGLGLHGDEKMLLSDELISLRNNISYPAFFFAENEWKYAFSCLGYAGYEILENTYDSYYIISDDRREILEYVTSTENFKENTEILVKKAELGTTVVSPYDLSDYCECKENKFGMIYFADNEMKENITGDIYMNIALD